MSHLSLIQSITAVAVPYAYALLCSWGNNSGHFAGNSENKNPVGISLRGVNQLQFPRKLIHIEGSEIMLKATRIGSLTGLWDHFSLHVLGLGTGQTGEAGGFYSLIYI